MAKCQSQHEYSPYHGIIRSQKYLSNIRCVMVAIKYFELTRGSEDKWGSGPILTVLQCQANP